MSMKPRPQLLLFYIPFLNQSSFLGAREASGSTENTPGETENKQESFLWWGMRLLLQDRQWVGVAAWHTVISNVYLPKDLIFKRCPQAGELTQWARAFAVKPDLLSSIPRNYIVDGEKRFLKVVLWPSQTYSGYTHIIIITIKETRARRMNSKVKERQSKMTEARLSVFSAGRRTS